MKITATKANLLHVLQTSAHKGGKNVIPILGGVLLEAQGEHLTATTTNLDVTIRSRVPVTVIEEGALCLPSRQMADFIKVIPDIEIKIESEGDAAKIFYDDSQVTFNGYSPEQFPAVPEVSERTFQAFQVPAKLLKETIAQTAYAALKDQARPTFTGVLFDCNEKLKFVATDTHRLALRKTDIETLATDVIVPAEALSEVAKIIRNGNIEIIKIGIDNNHIMFEAGDTVLISRLIAGQFPNYQQVIPTEFTSVLTAKTNELIETITRASLLLDDVSVVQITMDNDVTASADTPAGWIKEKVNGSYQGKPMRICFNTRYMLDALRAITDETTVINFTGPLSAAVIKPASGDNYLGLLLPTRSMEE